MKHKYRLIFIVFLFYIVGCTSTNTKIQNKKQVLNSHDIYRLIDRLNNQYLSISEKKDIIEQLGNSGNSSVIGDLNKVLLNNKESELWMNVAYALEKLGIKDALEAQTEYEKIRVFEKDYYYIRSLDEADLGNLRQYQKIIDAFSTWASHYPNHPKVPNIEISIKYFKKINENISLEKVYANPSVYLSKTIEWEGIIKEIDMKEDKVQLLILSGVKKWFSLMSANKFIPELHIIGANVKIKGDIATFIKEEQSNIPVVNVKKIW